MPFRSQAQPRHTPKGKRLPRRKRPTANRRKSPLRLDPTRTATLRRRFEAEVRRRFDRLKGEVWRLIAVEDAFGLREAPQRSFQINAEFSSTHVTVDDRVVMGLVDEVQQRLDPADVIELEDEPHVTVLYGLHVESSEPVERLIRQAGKAFVKLGGLSLFETPEHDVLKVDVESNDLRRLNRELKMLDHTQTYRDYSPHLTIAYLKRGTGRKYLDLPTSFDGQEMWFDTLIFSDADRNKAEIALNAEATLPLFVYSTLRKRYLLDRVAKDREVAELLALLHGWRRELLPERHGYYTIVPDPDGTVEGDVVRLTRTELRRTDAWETQYERRVVEMPDGSDAYAYVWRDEPPTTNAWTFSCCGWEVCQGCPGSSVLVANAGKPRSSPPIVNSGAPTQSRPTSPVPPQFTANARFTFHTASQKVEQFRRWLATQVQHSILGTMSREIENAWWTQYARRGYEQGAGRAFDDVKRPLAKAQTETGMAFYRGTREQFLRDSFAHPVAVDKVKLLAGRVLTELEGVTDAMSQKMTRELTDGLVEGQSPREVARAINREVDGVGKNRALVIARTETIRAHAEGQLDALKNLGVQQVGVAVEWSTAEDEDVCEECEPLEGVVLDIDEARGMIPRHPNCRCAWIPANVGEDDEDQTRDKEDIDDAIEESVDAEGGDESTWSGVDAEINEDRPGGLV